VFALEKGKEIKHIGISTMSGLRIRQLMAEIQIARRRSG